MSLNDCGCCNQDGEDRNGIWNDPALSRIDYRIDRFGGFKRSMRSAINLESALGRLTTRDDADAVMAVVDAWAATLDVLTFYQERIANENYLRTAKEYRSVQEFSRQIGYRLAPGTAATTHLAFKVDDTGYGPESVRVDAGTKVQSQPGQDELPQVYETLETVVARPEYNVLPVKHYAKDQLTTGRNRANFVGTGFEVKVGDTLLFVADASVATPSQDKKALAKVTRVTRDDSRKVTTLEWSPFIPSTVEGGAGPSVFLMRQRVGLFGYNAIDFASLPLTLTIGDKSPKDGTFIAGPYASESGKWADAKLTGKTIDLDSLYPAIPVGSWVVLQNSTTTTLFRVDETREVLASRFMMSSKVTHLTLDREALTAFSPKDATVLAQSEALTLDTWPIDAPLSGKRLEIARIVDRPEKGRKLLIVGKRPRAKMHSGGPLQDRDGTTLATVPAGEVVRTEGVPFFVAGQLRYRVIRDDGMAGYMLVYPGTVTYHPALAEDPADLGEVVAVAEIQTGAADDEILITEDLKYAYDRASSRIYANIAYASHGETKKEILGSGNAAAVFQRFELSNTPLTYLAAATETGYQSQLEVRVNDLLWHEVPTLYGHGPEERIYTARDNERRKTQVGFGNGITGARTETGVENVAAKYRVGSGLVGRVRAGQLNMLLTRPLGVTEATNPLAATGGSDGESVGDALANIPRSALTLGRIVSVQDFADHAGRYPGIAKAQSSLLWHGNHQVVYLTVAGPDGETIDTKNLEGSIDSVRDTHFPVEVGVSERLRFAVSLEVLVRADYLKEKVLAAVRRRLTEDFGFARRDFSEAVTGSEVLAVVQQVEGVEAANVLVLDFANVATPALHDVLRIKPARSQAGGLLPAQILTIAPDRIEVKEMKSDV